jgi:hypothetical protein
MKEYKKEKLVKKRGEKDKNIVFRVIRWKT